MQALVQNPLSDPDLISDFLETAGFHKKHGFLNSIQDLYIIRNFSCQETLTTRLSTRSEETKKEKLKIKGEEDEYSRSQNVFF